MSSMGDRPQVYMSGKLERLEFHRERLEKASKRDRSILALEQERAIHQVLMELVQEQELLVGELRAMRNDMKILMKKLNGGVE